jgi:cell division protease FtsH
MNIDNSEKKDLRERLSGNRRSGCSLFGMSIWLILLVVASLWVFGVFDRSQAVEISYSAFRQQVQDGNVARVTVTGEQIQGELQEPVDQQVNGETITYDQFTTYLPSFGDEALLTLLEEQGVEVQTEPESDFSWTTLLINALPILVLLGLGYLMVSRMRNQGRNIFSVGSSQAELYDLEEEERTTFDDVAGSQEVKTELREIIEFLKHPERFRALGGEMPRGVLLVGPPGTGKTLLARAVAGEAEVPFYSITGSNFMEMFVGVGASRVRNMFEDAKKSSPSIIFIDELDSIGRQRGTGLGGGHDEREQTLNQLLSEMDGFEVNEGVVVMAATNRPDILDPALLRPGRFDRRITVKLPTKHDREKILEIHAQDKPLAENLDLERVAQGTPGFSGADLENLLNEAALLAARKEKDEIEYEDIEQARDKVMMGLKRKNLALGEEECRLLAYHEGGHAIVAALLPHADPVHKVTIVPRGRAMGVTQQFPEKDKYIYKREYMLDRLAVMMGGRAAEKLVFESTTSGAENDLKQATQLARRMVLDWGMSEEMGPLAFGGESDEVFLGQEIARRRSYSEETARQVDLEIKQIVENAYERANETLREHRDHLDRLAEILLEREEIPGDEVLSLVKESEEEESSSDESEDDESVEEA